MVRSNLIKKAAFLFFLGSHILLIGNTGYKNLSDAGLWTTVAVEYNIRPRYTLILSEEVRLYENTTRLNLLFTNVGLRYKINKHLSSSLSYRAIQLFNNESSFTFKQRIQWDILSKKKFRRVELSYKHRLQGEFKTGNPNSEVLFPKLFSRNRIRIKYTINKYFRSYASVELRYPFRTKLKPETAWNHWDRIRYQAGIDFKIKSGNTLGIYYLMQQKFSTKCAPEKLYVIGIEYTLNIK